MSFGFWILAVCSRAQVGGKITTNLFDQLIATQPPIANPSAFTATAIFDPPTVEPGEKAVYRITINDSEASIVLPDEIPAPPQLRFRKTASGQIMQPSPGGLMTFAAFDFDVRASAPGEFTVPEFVAQASGQPVSVPAATLNVQPKIAGEHERVRQFIVEPLATNVFVGQPLDVRILLPGSPAHPIEGVAQIQLDGDGFVSEKKARALIQQLTREGRTEPTYIYQTTITPIAAGEIKVSAQGFTSGMQFNAPIVISGGRVSIAGDQPRYVLLDSEPATIHVRPLPETEMPGYTGAVGSFLLATPKLSTNVVRVGDPVELTAIVCGQGNLNRINPPPPPQVKGWQIFPAVRLGIIADPRAGISGAGFSYTLIPVNADVRETPAIPFSCFNPEQGAFANLTIPPLPITVRAGDAPVNEDFAAASEAQPEAKLRLSKLAESAGSASSLVPLQMRAWMPLAQISPAVALCGLWLLDRRRKYLEQHPEIVRRRKARRALRREMREVRRAEAARDEKKFVACAVNAMRIASAPHFPAEPRALVCGDVLEALGTEARSGGAEQVVRKFFDSADASSFSVSKNNFADLLNERKTLGEVLQKLEARLN